MNANVLMSDLAHNSNPVQFAMRSLTNWSKWEQAIFHFANQEQVNQYVGQVRQAFPNALIGIEGNIVSVKR